MKVLNIGQGALNAYFANAQPTLFKRPRSWPSVNDRSSKADASYSPFDLFQWLPLEAQNAFTLASRRMRYADGHPIFSQGEPGNEMFRIVSGSVRMSFLRLDGREALYLILGPGDCFGMRSLVDAAPRSLTTSAQSDVELQVLRRDAFERLRSQHPAVGDGLLQLISLHVRLLCEYFASSTLDDLPRRVAQRLLAQRLLEVKKPNVTDASGMQLTVRLSQSEIALMVGASRQAVNKVLQKLQSDGLISIEYGSVQIHDVDRLQSIT